MFDDSAFDCILPTSLHSNLRKEIQSLKQDYGITLLDTVLSIIAKEWPRVLNLIRIVFFHSFLDIDLSLHSFVNHNDILQIIITIIF